MNRYTALGLAETAHGLRSIIVVSRDHRAIAHPLRLRRPDRRRPHASHQREAAHRVPVRR